ncbi:MAG TPA: aspartyl-phosphate phosphatase Spo0E family protein [Candidatus Dormibacteraeota bacterium]|nr:aspartyl-phosphate phosphatase Spo0E family protein [Candidatus Dormibacteraeota bacterium]
MELKSLQRKIESLKVDLIKSGEENGMNHPKTIKISQELDKVINAYMKSTEKK